MMCILIKPVNKVHPGERHNMVFIGNWSLYGGYLALFYLRRVLLNCDLYLQGGLYSKVAFNTSLTVMNFHLFI